MNTDVAFDALRARIAEFGTPPFLITSTADGHPHVVSVGARVGDGCVVVAAGRTSRANLVANAAATLLWPAPAGSDYSLIVDGKGALTDDGAAEVSLRPTRAVLHRMAGASRALPNCVRILPGD